MANVRLFLIHLADWFDDRVLRHRFMWICSLIGMSGWWGDGACYCRRCDKSRRDFVVATNPMRQE